MTKKRVKGAKIISEELDLLTRKWILASSFAFFPESYGLVTSKYGKEIWMTYREYTPRPYIKGERLMIPFFSLFGKDPLKRNDPTLLTQILSYKTHKKDFFLNKLIKSLLISFKTLVLDWGLVPESHGQNIVLEIDPDLKNMRIIHRDLYEFYADIQLREKNKLDVSKFYKTLDINKDKEIYFQMKSYLFDFKLGEYVLYPLVQEFCKMYWYQEKNIINEIIDLFESLSPEWRNIFKPYNKYYYFENIVNTYINGKPNFKEGLNPRFRTRY